jgi:sugar phosphate isomerase/epimerase
MITHRLIRNLQSAAVTVVFCTSVAASAAADTKPAGALPNPFFALCMDTHDAQKRTLEQQAQMLQELGYDGAGHLWLDQVPERIRTLDAVGLKLFQIYIRIDVTPEVKRPYDPKLKEVIPLLKGRDTMLAVLMGGGKPADESCDARAVELLREIAGLAKDSGVRIALYPHTGDWLERLEDALRVADKVDRPNVGVMFNLCHWLRVEKQRKYRPLLERAMPRLFAISINGADEFDEQPGWNHYIQPLGRGSFDMFGLLKTLHQLGYSGPVGLQCYGIQGNARDALDESMKAWRSYSARLAADK